MLLNTRPEQRPSCEEILKLPFVQSRVKILFPDLLSFRDQVMSQQLLETIKVGRNNQSQFFQHLEDILPQSAYSGSLATDASMDERRSDRSESRQKIDQNFIFLPQIHIKYENNINQTSNLSPDNKPT